MVRRHLFATCLAFSIALLASFGECFATATQESTTGSFYGGYHHLNLSSKERASLTLEFTFRTVNYESGLLFVAVQKNHVGYLAALLRDCTLEIVLERSSQSPQTLHSFSLSFQNTSSSTSNWHSLSVHYQESHLSVILDSANIHSQTLVLEEDFSDLFLAGIDLFFSPNLFNDLSLSGFFIGCLTNVTANSVPVQFVPDHQNGIGTECCLIPRTPMWCFQSTNSSVSIPTTLNNNASIQISFNLQAIADGLVLFAEMYPSQFLQLQLSGHNLTLAISNSEKNDTETLDCPVLPTKGDWHLVEVTLTSESVRCAVGGVANGIAVSMNLSAADLILGSAEVQGVHQTSFDGCVRQFKVNNVEIGPLLGNHLLHRSDVVEWSDVTFDLHPLVVDEGEGVRVAAVNIRMTLPEQFFADPFAFLYQQELERAIQIEVVEGPYQGDFFVGPWRNHAVSQFSYDALTSDDNETQIFYQHSVSSRNVTDEALINVSIDCGSSTRTLFSGMLEITVIENTDNHLILKHNEAITIAGGTSRLIEPSHVTVVSRENPHPKSVTFSLQTVDARDNCEMLCDERRGRLFKTYNPNLNAMFFSQEELNDGNISFQHFEKFGTEPVVIRLQASTNGGYSINVTIDVYPYDGQITFLTPPGICLFVKEHSTALLEPKHLNSTTNFEDQNPVISYDLIQDPRYGYFERFTYQYRYPNWRSLTSVSPSNNFFTQDDIDSGHVRYVHNHSSAITNESEDFKFRLRSTNLTGSVESLCIHIVAQVLLVQPVISISAETIQVDEGGRVNITRDLLTTTPSQMEEYVAGVVDIEQMGIVYNLETVPAYGHLFVGERELSKGDNFTFDNVSSSLLHYVHSGSENHNDSFQVYAVATTTSTLLILTPDPSATVTVKISVTPVNDHLPQLGSNLTNIEPPEGGFVVVTEKNILVTDEDRPNDVLTIFIKKKRTTPIGHFAFYRSPSTPVSRFSMQNVSERQVIFVHWLGAELNLTQIIRLEDGNKMHYVRQPINITAIPLKLTVERQNSGCLANIDATLEEFAVRIQGNEFRFMLQNHLGQDRNLVPEINVTVSSPPKYGHFNNRVSEELGLSRFTVGALQNSAIEYHFTNQSTTAFSDEFSWTFQYGSSVVGPLQFQICISPIPIPQIVRINNASVAYGGMVNLDSSNLLATDNRGGASMNDSLIYRILTLPQNGSIIDQRADVVGASLINFTQTDLNHARVVYQNKYSDMFRNMQDSFTFQVCTLYECTDPAKFFIHIRFVNLTVLNTGFAVKEGGRFNITTSVLNIFAPPMSRRRRFYITQERKPKHGNITLIGATGNPIVDVQFFDLEDLEAHSVYYQNDGDENIHDNFEFTATADYTNEATGKVEPLTFTDMVNITIIPVNDNSPEFVKLTPNLPAVKHGSTRISGELFRAHDFDSDMNDEDIVWIPQHGSPVYGYLYLGEDQGRAHAVFNWTERDLRANRLFYRNDEGGSNDFISYIVTDGERKSDSEITFITLHPILFKSQGTKKFMVVEGGNTTITTEHLRNIASNDNSLGDQDILYIIQSTPAHGVLMFDGNALGVGSSFSQLGIRNGLLMYIHDHSNSERDGFQYSLAVINRTNDTSTLYSFIINIKSVDDDPPEVTIVQDHLFVVEMSRVHINESLLEIYDLDLQNKVDSDYIFCQIISFPMHGLLTRHRFGRQYRLSSISNEFTKYDVVNNQIWYNHTTLGAYEDNFSFRVTDGINPQNETYEVSIIVLPNEVEIRVYSITVAEGHMVLLEREDFVIDHAYLNRIPGRFEIISPPSSGNITNVHTGACTRRISEFTTVDLSNHHIIYCHNGKEIDSDSFQFRYESLEPEGLHRQSLVKTMFISIKPVDDEPPIFARERMSANIIYGQEIILNEQYLNVSDSDTTDLTHLNYTFTLNIHGHIAYTENPMQSIRWFTQADVVAGRVKFIQDSSNELNGNIEFNVTDGKQFAFATLDITIRVLTLKCDENSWSKVSVKAGGEVVLTADHLSCYIIAYNNSGAVTFSMSKPRHGYFVVGGKVKNNFTQEEINQYSVRYIHNDFEFWEEEEQINASATHKYVQPRHFHLVIHVQYPHSNTSLASNEGLQLNEGASACLNESILDVRNLRYNTWIRLQGDNHPLLPFSPRGLVPVFNLTRLPDHGLLVVNSTKVVSLPASFTHTDVARGAVCYQHSGSEDFKDSVRFQLLFQLTSQNITESDLDIQNPVEESILMKINPINDQQPEVVALKILSLVLGFPITITANELNVVDRDSPPGNITFTVLDLPRSAELFLGGNKLEVNAEFTQADINNQQVSIRPLSTTVEIEQLILSFRDELEVYKQVKINYSVSEHDLTISKKEKVTYQQNVKEVTITSAHLNISTNGYRRETLFTVLSSPVNGRIDVKGVGQASRFSQVDVDEGRIMYIPRSNTSAYEDKVVFRVSNNNKELNVSINFTSLARGTVKEDAVIDLTSSSSQLLPRDLLLLTDFPASSKIRVPEKPRYGVLRIGPDKQSGNNFSFYYDDLTDGRVKYIWDYHQRVLEDPVFDNFTMLVVVESMPPGLARISLKVHPPKDYNISSPTSQTVAPHHTNHPRDQFPLTSSDNEGFPLYSLFPILGTFVILVITIVIIVLFCITQQKRYRKKWLPGVTRSPIVRMYPWSINSHPPSQGPRAMAPPNYNFDPASQSGESDNEEHNSETSSGFSEPVSPRHSPTQAFPVQAHSQQNSHLESIHSVYGTPSLVPPRAKSRARSNVSVTFSSRQSVGSEVSIDDSPQYYSHSLPRPLHKELVVVPTPVRPASHSAFSRVPRPNATVESGYNSGMFPGAEDSGVPSRAGSQAGSCAGYEEDNSELPPFPSADVDVSLGLDERLSGNMLPTLSCPSDAGPGPVELKSSLAIGELDLNDPNILHMLRSPNPVLRKEEYWV